MPKAFADANVCGVVIVRVLLVCRGHFPLIKIMLIGKSRRIIKRSDKLNFDKISEGLSFRVLNFHKQKP